MVGNDIIDRKETKRSTLWERRGFLEKIFTIQEQSIINNFDDPFTLVWRLWSMKEAAYKVFIQAGGDRFYNPRRIECSVEHLIGQVSIGAMVLKTQTLINEDYIFSTATIRNSEVKTGVFRFVERDTKKQSDFVREQLINDYAECNDLDCGELLVRKSKNGVPGLYYQGINLDVSVSLTHHGEYGGYSFFLENED